MNTIIVFVHVKLLGSGTLAIVNNNADHINNLTLECLIAILTMEHIN